MGTGIGKRRAAEGGSRSGRRARSTGYRPVKVNDARRWREAAERGWQAPAVSSRPVRDPRLRPYIVDGVEPFPGAVAIARVAMKDYPTPKARPVVLVEARRAGEAWTAWCLTTKRTFAHGGQRPVAVGVEQVGLQATCLWGAAVEIPAASIEGVVWAAPYELLLACALCDVRLRPVGGDHRAMAERMHADLVEGGWYWPKPR